MADLPTNTTTTKHPKILDITLDSKLTFLQHTNLTITKAKQMLNNLNTLFSTKWDKQQKLVVFSFKAVTHPILKYAKTI